MPARRLAAFALAAGLALAGCSGGGSGSAAGAGGSRSTGGPASTVPPGDRFVFGVIGDAPYTPDQVPKFDRMVDEINQAKPALILHVGDVGAQPCTDAALNASLAAINRLTMPVVYTPGDNEWTDCHQSGNDPIQRLARVRQSFFPTDQSLGQKTLTVTRQSDYPEDARFSFGGLTFVSLHEVGSNNGVGRTADADAEAGARQKAVLDWMKAGFASATASSSLGIVLFFQADPNFDLYGVGVHNAHTPFLQELERQSIAYKRPVLLVHGDTHVFKFDKAFVGSADRRPIENVTRLENFGSPDVHWSRVTVDPSTPELFSAAPAIVASNVAPHTPPP